ncbi:MAG: hypothetical protein ACUVS2_02010 [Candidatus Flexifilum sp.]
MQSFTHSRTAARGLIAALLALLIGFGADGLRAQPIIETFTAAGQTHFFRHQSANDWSRVVRSSIETAITTYQPMFDVSTAPLAFPVVITEVEPAELPSALADAALVSRDDELIPADVRPLLTRPTVCHMRIKNDLRFDILPHALAHELAHCFQLQYVSATWVVRDPLLPIHGWWAEGGANWLASRVFPDSYVAYVNAGSRDPGILMQRWRGAGLMRGGIRIGYNVAPLWEFLSRPDQLGGVEAIIPTWKRISPTITTREEMERQIPDLIPRTAEAFQAFARALASDSIPLQVLPSQFVPVHTVTLPGSHSFPMSNLVWDAQTFVVTGLPENARVQLVLTGMYEGSEARAGLEDAALPGVWRDFVEGEPQFVCAHGGIARFTITTSRGYNAGLGARLDPLNLELTLSAAPCSRADSEAFACMAGTWGWVGSMGANTGLEDEREGLALMSTNTTLTIDHAGNVEFTIYGQMFRGNWAWTLFGERTGGLLEVEALGDGRYRVIGWSVPPVVALRGSYMDAQGVVHEHTTSSRARIPTPLIIHCNSPETYGALALQYEEMDPGELLRAEYWYRMS